MTTNIGHRVYDENRTNSKDLLETTQLYALAIKRDRWVFYEAGDLEGELLTRPFTWEGGGALYLNAQIAAGGKIIVEFEDQWARPIRDMHLDEIPPITGPLDAVDHHLTFGPGPKTIVKLPHAIGPIRLRFRMQKAKLYGWSVSGPAT